MYSLKVTFNFKLVVITLNMCESKLLLITIQINYFDSYCLRQFKQSFLFLLGNQLIPRVSSFKSVESQSEIRLPLL